MVVQLFTVLRLMEGRGQSESIFSQDFRRNGQGMKMGSRKALKPIKIAEVKYSEELYLG